MKKLVIIFSVILLVLIPMVLAASCQQQPPISPETSTPTPTPSPSTPKPAEFILSDLTITPNEVNTGESVIIEVMVTNIGELSDTCNIDLKIDDIVEGTEKVTLDGGDCQKVTFTKTKSVAKTYSVCIGDLASSFLVKASPPPPEPATPS